MKGPTRHYITIPIEVCTGCEELEEREYSKSQGKYHYYCKAIDDSKGSANNHLSSSCSPWTENKPVVITPHRKCPYRTELHALLEKTVK